MKPKVARVDAPLAPMESATRHPNETGLTDEQRQEFHERAMDYRGTAYGASMKATQQAWRDLEAYVESLVLAERQACWDAIDAAIVRGPLSGNGCDKSAERNGLIIATNIIFQRRWPIPVSPPSSRTVDGEHGGTALPELKKGDS